MTTVREVAERLGMRAHPEGGWYVETWQPTGPDRPRGPGSAILFLLGAGERSHWHRLDADEIWQWSGGDELELRTWTEGDAKIWGTVEDVQDPALHQRYAESLFSRTGFDLRGRTFEHFFRTRLAGAAAVETVDEHLDITVWKQGSKERVIRKH